MAISVLTFAAFLTVFQCNADDLPPPREFHYEWINPIALKLIWKEPGGLPKGCGIQYEVISSQSNSTWRTPHTEWEDCPRETLNIDHWTYTITTVRSNHCGIWKNSAPVTLNVSSQMPQADLVKDFRCALDAGGMNCSWISVHLSQKLFFCKCTSPCEQVCDQPYSSENRKGCYIAAESPKSNILFLVKSATNESIVHPHIELPIPELSVTEEGHQLKLTWRPKETGSDCWSFEFCYTKCNENEECLNITKGPYNILYNQNCEYKFRTRVLNKSYCPSWSSEWRKNVTYGVNKLPGRTLTIVSIVVPIILFASVILSCYCFKKQSEILCPNTPDPSAIFKELMEHNGNREHKSETQRLYRPVAEVIEHGKISIITDNSDNKAY